MFDFESVKFAYENGWATPQDLDMYVEFGVLTSEQVKEILGVNNDLPEVEEPVIEEPLEEVAD